MVGFVTTQAEPLEASTNAFSTPAILVASALVVSLVVLAVSGVVLAFTYRPRVHEFWPRGLHRVAATAALWLAVLLAALSLVRWLVERGDSRRLRGSAVVAGLGVVVILFASFTGYLLPWDQLALLVGSAPTDFRGIDNAAFSHSVRFVLIGGSEVGRSTYRLWAVLHTIAVPFVLLALVGWAAMVRRRQPTG